MEEQMQMDVQPESSPGTEPAPPTPTPAGAENTETQGQAPPEKQPPFHQHPRWQQMLGENRQLKAAVQTLASQMQQLQQAGQQQAGGLTPDQQMQYQQAARALREVMQNDPETKELLGLKQHVTQQLQQVRQSQMQALERQGVDRILSAAKTAGLPQGKEYLNRLIKSVEAEVLQLPEGRQRFAAGDLTVLDEAFANINEHFLGQMRRDQQAQTLATKDKTRQLPPAPRGGAAGPAGLPKLDPDNPRAFQTALNKRATELLNEKG